MRSLSTFFLAASCAVLARGATLHTDDFQAGGVAGWFGSENLGGDPPTVQPSGGPAGAGDAFLRIETPNSNFASRNFGAPWIGDYGAISADRVKLDMMIPSGEPALPIRFVLFGPGTTAERWTSTVALTPPADGVWRSYEFSLAESALTHVAGTSSYANLLGGVLGVMLRYDPGPPSAQGSATSGVLNVDNIQLASGTLPPLAGDFNGDDSVNGADLTDPAQGFYNRYGVNLNGTDLMRWQQQLGLSQAAAAEQAVAEPLGSGLISAAVCGLIAACRRRN